MALLLGLSGHDVLSQGLRVPDSRVNDVSKRAFNFCAGPAALPTAVLERAQAELLDWQGLGLSVMEMSHRSDAYVAIASKKKKINKKKTHPDRKSVV